MQFKEEIQTLLSRNKCQVDIIDDLREKVNNFESKMNENEKWLEEKEVNKKLILYFFLFKN